MPVRLQRKQVIVVGAVRAGQRVVEQAGQLPASTLSLPRRTAPAPQSGRIPAAQYGRRCGSGGVVDRVERQPRCQRGSGELPARVIHLQHGRGRNAQVRRQHQATVRLWRRIQTSGQRCTEAVAAVVVLKALHRQVHRRHERGHGAAGEHQGGLVNGHIHDAKRHAKRPLCSLATPSAPSPLSTWVSARL